MLVTKERSVWEGHEKNKGAGEFCKIQLSILHAFYSLDHMNFTKLI